MTKVTSEKTLRLLLAAAMLVPLSACFHDNDGDTPPVTGTPDTMASYEITVNNATNGQPLTPVAVIVHNAAYHPWVLGDAASVGLEMLAEGGDVTQFIADAAADVNVVTTASSSNGPFAPGATETVSVQVVASSALQISVAAMLANTNDAFTGIANVLVGNLLPGEHTSMLAHVYDAGTESNSESADTLPGPAGNNGEGFNATRDDSNFVSIHAGVVTADDGLSTSALNESHRWIGPAAKITITRIQ